MSVLVTATAYFHTRDDDKDDDTVLAAAVYLPDGTLVADVVGITGRFPDDRDNGPFGLTVHGRVDRSKLGAALAALHSEPNGDDTWKFNWRLILAFDDGTQHTANWDGPFLSDDVKDRIYALRVPPVKATTATFPKAGGKVRREA